MTKIINLIRQKNKIRNRRSYVQKMQKSEDKDRK